MATNPDLLTAICRRRCATAAVAFVCLLPTGCAYRYAKVYVNTVRMSTHTAVPVNLYDGRSGLSLGETPTTLVLKTRHPKSYPPLSLIDRPGQNGCPTYWQVAGVANWSGSISEASDATKVNQVLFVVNDADLQCGR
jgi:hypothetical protein